MSYLRLCFGRGCGHSEPASYEFRCAARPSTPELRYCGQLLRREHHEYLYGTVLRYQIGNVPVGTTVVFLDKAEQDGVGAAARNSRSAKNRRMRGCTG